MYEIGKLKDLYQNVDCINETFDKESAYIKQMVALVYWMKDKKLETDNLMKMNHQLAKHRNELHSTKRNILLCSSMRMCFMKVSNAPLVLNDNEENKCDDSYFGMLIHKSQLSTQLFQCCDIEEYRRLLILAKDEYLKIKHSHLVISMKSDLPFVLLMQTTDTNLENVEELYSRLSNVGFKKGNNLLKLSILLTGAGIDMELTVKKCLLLRARLIEEKNFQSIDMYIVLGVMVVVGLDGGKELDLIIAHISALYLHAEFKEVDLESIILIVSMKYVYDNKRESIDALKLDRLILIALDFLITRRRLILECSVEV